MLSGLCGGEFVAQSAASAASIINDANVLDRQFFFPVTLNPGDTQSYNLWGELRSARPTAGQTLLVLVHGFTYDHRYWDFPSGPSFVTAAEAAGYAVLNLDRLGTGYSSRPDGSILGLAQDAYSIHEVIQTVGNGALSGFKFGKVVLVGHSAGSVLSALEASTYHDVSGVVLTGVSHTAGSGAADSIAAVIPVDADPVLATQGYPADYITFVAGAIGQLFYYPATSIPSVIATNESLKGAGAVADEQAIGGFVSHTLPVTGITVPVLEVFGAKDVIVGDLNTAQTIGQEPGFYPNSPSVQVVAIPNTGHDLALSTTALETDLVIGTWLVRHGLGRP